MNLTQDIHCRKNRAETKYHFDKINLTFSKIFLAPLISISLVLKTHPVYLLGRCIGKYVGTEVSSAISYSCPCYCHHRLCRKKHGDFKKCTSIETREIISIIIV